VLGQPAIFPFIVPPPEIISGRLNASLSLYFYVQILCAMRRHGIKKKSVFFYSISKERKKFKPFSNRVERRMCSPSFLISDSASHNKTLRKNSNQTVNKETPPRFFRTELPQRSTNFNPRNPPLGCSRQCKLLFFFYRSRFLVASQ
jgi:hypothetical protein